MVLKVSEQINKQNNSVNNQKIWGDLIFNVKVYGAKGDGVTDDSTSILVTINAAKVSGGTVFFPPGTYKLDIPIQFTISNSEFTGVNATIDCRGTSDIPGVNGQGGGMTVTGNNNVFRGLSFLGYHADQGSTLYGFGDLLAIIGNLNKVIECNFAEGNSGALYFNGNKNLVTESNFDTCNNHAIAGADFGAINIIGGYGNIVSNCWIENQYYSGIAVFGDVTKTKLLDNYIKCSSPLGQDTSMGIYVFDGGARDLDIIGNTIENVTAEAMAIFSKSTLPTENVTIENNTMRDYDGTGLAIYMSTDSATSTNVKISNNTFQSKTLDPGFHIYTEMMNKSSIVDNTILGRETGVGTIGTGIHVGSTPNSNIVKDNHIFNVGIGIFFADFLGGDCSNNEIVKCTTGISYQNCQRAKISGNNIADCTTPLNKVLNADFAFVAGNMISGQTTAPNGIAVYGDMQTTTGATSPYATGTLTAGSATITFFNIDDGDAFVVIPTSYAVAANCGALYVAEQNASLDTMIIKSTNAADTRKFFVLKIARGGLS
ncbi:right-handed parallel beta-helix repeat-containing protein [Paenibacillus harenae]|uniref:right-handed parallel beta-helix repeat-containing protein n=1 Tax=Paenibacillus harenae TaxID=306543 RepID=UPI00278DB2D3|nr:right-handed parallel beta-helix repeat-containing protein [Paenibacillus harenae]MDQ0062387.1 hypothetical protein [Paenibacillus harenae]